MREETEQLIRTSLREFLSQYDLSEARVRSIIETEVKEPCGWWHPDDDKEGADPDAHIVRYYGNLTDKNVLVSFIDHVHSHYCIYLPHYGRKEA